MSRIDNNHPAWWVAAVVALALLFYACNIWSP